MAAKIFRINYKSDFILTLNSDAGWMTPFCIKFWTGAPSQAYFVGFDGTTYTHCAPVAGEPTKLVVQFDDHHLPIGDLKFQIAYHFTVADFPNDTEDEVINPASIIIEINGEQYQVMLDFTGETAPEIEFSLPAYANEAQRIANEEQRIENEQQRISNEQQRITNEEGRISAEATRQSHELQRIHNEEARIAEFASLKADAIAATDAANTAASLAQAAATLASDKAALAQAAATLANEKAQLAADKAALAQAAATLANDKAALAQQKALYAQAQGDYAKTQGDYAKDQGDYAKEQGDTALADHQRAESDHGIAVDDHTQAGNDHTRAESDHGIAADDHTQAGNDHTRAESDHGIAANDHTQAGNDHTRAESDHTRAESDHAAVEVYVDSLGAFDISAYHATGGVLAKYADLTDALGTGGANIPDALRKGGMSVKFVQSSDNKYVQYRYMGTATTGSPNPFLDAANWQGVDDVPTAESNNLVKSGGVADSLQYVKFEEKELKFSKDYILNNWSDNYIDTSGVLKNGSGNYYCSPKIYIQKDSKIILTRIYGVSGVICSVACYREDNTFVSQCSYTGDPVSSTNPVTLDTDGYNIAYIRITYGGGLVDNTLTCTVKTEDLPLKEKVADIDSEVSGLSETVQSLQPKLTAGNHIAIDENNVISADLIGAVLFDAPQELSYAQKAQGRNNIGAANNDDINYVVTEEINCATAEDIATWDYGYIKPNGTIQTATSGVWKYSDKIYIIPDSTIRVELMYCNTAVTSLAAYNSSDQLVSECSISQSTNISPSTGPVVIDTDGYNIAYIRISYSTGGSPSFYNGFKVYITQITGTKTIKQKIAEIEDEFSTEISELSSEIDNIGIGTQWDGKSWVALGTSITDTKNSSAPDGTSTGKFVPKLVDLSGLVVHDYGVSGAVMGGHILYYATHPGSFAGADLVTVEGGVNDWIGNRPIGQVGDTVPYHIQWSSPSWDNGGNDETGTFAGAVYQVLLGVMQNYPNAQIVVLTDNTGKNIPTTGANCTRERLNGSGLKQYDYTKMLIDVANYMGISVINAGQRSMINQENPDYLIDQIHQTEVGGEQYANIIWSELKNTPNKVVNES